MEWLKCIQDLLTEDLPRQCRQKRDTCNDSALVSCFTRHTCRFLPERVPQRHVWTASYWRSSSRGKRYRKRHKPQTRDDMKSSGVIWAMLIPLSPFLRWKPSTSIALWRFLLARIETASNRLKTSFSGDIVYVSCIEHGCPPWYLQSPFIIMQFDCNWQWWILCQSRNAMIWYVKICLSTIGERYWPSRVSSNSSKLSNRYNTAVIRWLV